MRKRWLTVGIGFAVAALIGAAFVTWYNERESAERLHFERDESQLIVAKTTGAVVQLFAAGEDLDAAREIAGFDGARIWLSKGNYFLKVDQSGQISYYPVPVYGYRGGPDENGSIKVTIRQYPAEFPPRLLSGAPQFIYVPSGPFLLGDRLNPSEPHYVWVAAFFMSPIEATNGEFREFLNDPDGYSNPIFWTKEGIQWKDSTRCQASAMLKPGDADYPRFGQPGQPVTNVNWYEANAYCKWLTKRLGGGKWLFALPNDAEWEKAGRGPDSFDYGMGGQVSDNQIKLYNWRKNPDAPITVVDFDQSKRGYRPNRYGLYHMSGNVAEWQESIHLPYSRQKPYEDDERNHDEVSGLRVVRGGSWYSASNALLALCYRDSFQPEHHSNERGFRIVAHPLPFKK